MKIPRTINIGGYTYKVLQDYDFRNDKELIGIADTEYLEIRLKSAKNPQVLKQVLLHEILHCIDYVFNDNKLIDQDATVDNLSQGLFQVFSQLEGKW